MVVQASWISQSRFAAIESLSLTSQSMQSNLDSGNGLSVQVVVAEQALAQHLRQTSMCCYKPFLLTNIAEEKHRAPAWQNATSFYLGLHVRQRPHKRAAVGSVD